MNEFTPTDSALARAAATALDQLRRFAGPIFAAMESSGMPMLVTDPRLSDNPIVFANAGFMTLTGYSLDEIIGRNCRFLQGPETDRETVSLISASVRNGKQIETEVLNYRKDGKTFWNNLFITPVFDPTGELAFFLGTTFDITAAHDAKTTETKLQNRQKELDEANERLRILLSIAGATASWEWHIAEGRIIGDARFAALYGLNANEAAYGVAPNRFFSIIHPLDQARIRLAVGGMLLGAEVFSKEYRLLLADGSMRWVHGRGRCYYDLHERPTRFSGVLVDVTEQKSVEEKLRIAQIAGGIGTFEYIDGFATVSVSEQFCHLLGLQAARDLPIRTINGVIHPEDLPLIDLGSPPDAGSVSQIEFRIIRPDNGQMRWLTLRGERLYDAETAGLRFSGVVYDVTDAKKTEEQLRNLNETLETRVEERTRERDRIWQVSRDLYFLGDLNGQCQSANPAWTKELGYATGPVPGCRLYDFIHPEDRGVLEAVLGKLATEDYIPNVDMRVRSENGQYRAFSWTYVSDESVFLAAGRDVTQRNELEEQLRQSQKMEAVGQLTGGIAHDFNNLLTGISGSLDMVRRRLSAGRMDSIDRLMDAAATSAQRAAALTHRLLAFSRQQTLDISPLDINQLVASIEDLLRRTLGEQVNLSVDLAHDLWRGLSDSNQLENAILNLAINARDAMPDGGRLAIATSNKSLSHADTKRDGFIAGDYVAITVSDTGSGMPPEVIEKAFDPFFTTKPIGQGTGLGLSMIYGFTKQSGGHVHIDSEVGKGTAVTLYLPRFAGQSALQRVDENTKTQAHLPGAEGETVLVVEDEPAVRLLMLEVLEDLGYQTIEAIDSRGALPVLESSRKVDLMVSDIGLPGLTGRQLAEIARQYRPELKILFITGYAENAGSRADLLQNATDMISKPFAIDVLAKKIREMLAGG